MKALSVALACLCALPAVSARAATATNTPTRGDQQLAAYFRSETRRLADRCLADIESAADWKANRDAYRQQLAEMLGLSPMPPRTDLKPVITGKLEHPEFTVEKLHFQSLPGLYVTANLYRLGMCRAARPPFFTSAATRT
jgi:hypothetical protein